jgi:hypothetical protein
MRGERWFIWGAKRASRNVYYEGRDWQLEVTMSAGDARNSTLRDKQLARNVQAFISRAWRAVDE